MQRHFRFRYKSPAHFLQVFRTYYGPVHKAFLALDENGQAALERDLTALMERFNAAGSDTLVIPSAYAEVIVQKS